MPVLYERLDDAAVITFDNPPLNVFGQAMRAGLQTAIARARSDRPDRLVLKGAGRAFVAGADAKEFDGPPLAPQLNDILAELINLPFPTIAAITGPALGGGLETSAGLPQPGGRAGRLDGSARGYPRHRAGRRGHAASAAPRSALPPPLT